jgi:hypothetical protein
MFVIIIMRKIKLKGAIVVFCQYHKWWKKSQHAFNDVLVCFVKKEKKRDEKKKHSIKNLSMTVKIIC